MGAPQVTIGEWITQATERHPDKPCLVGVDGTEHSFADVNTAVNRLTSALRREGVRRGDRIAVVAADSPQFLTTILAAMKLGATYVPLNVRLARDEVRTLVERAAPAFVFHDARTAGLVDGLTELPSVRRLVAYDGDAVGPRGAGWDELVASGDDTEPPVVASDADVLGLAFTSGTTGLPKGVMQSQRMIKNMTWNVLVEYRVRAEDVRYCAAPLFHISGMAMVFMGIAIGSTSVIAPQFDARTVLDLLARDRLDACFMVPTMISSVLALPDASEHAYDRLSLILYGAAPMTPALLERAMATFRCDFLNAFGAGTEAGLQTVLSPADHRRALQGAPHLLGSIGKPAVGVALRLTDEDMNDVREGEIGEITTRSDWVMDGYLEMPEASARSLRDGWFRAGDLAHRDAEGYLYLAGRKNDMIIRGGENVYPIEIESVLADHPCVADSAVVGVDDEHWGEVVHAFVVPRAGASVDAAELTTHCRARLAKYKVPEAFHVVDTMPLNASGKVLRRELRRRLVADTASTHAPGHPPASATPEESQR